MDIKDLILGIITILNLVLGLIIFLKDRKNKINLSFALFALSIAGWSLAILVFRFTFSESWAFWWIKFSYLAAVFIACSFWCFAAFFPENQSMPRGRKILLWVTTLSVIFFLLSSRSFIKGIIFHSWGKEAILGLFEYLVFSAYFLFFFFGALVIILKKYRKAKGLARPQLLNIFFSVFIPGTFGVIFNLILPSPYFENWRLIWLGPIFTFINVLWISYAIAKFQVMNIKVVATELFTSLIIIILAGQVFLAASISEMILRVVFLGLMLVLSILLIRSVNLEIHRREEIQKLAADLKVANKKLVELDKAKSEFLSIAAHQLRTPLTIVKGYISMIQEGDYGSCPNPKIGQVLDNVYQSNEHLIHLVNDLLDVARIEAGKVDYKFEPVNLEAVLKEVVKENDSRLKEKGLKLKVQIEKNLPAIQGDAEKLHHVIFNLFSNAIKYTEKGFIEAKLFKAEGQIVLEITDSGIGLSRSDRENIFQKFYRSENAKRVSASGVGLGLFVCRKFIEAHKGEIFAKSAGPGKGSVFGFKLPTAR